MELCTGRRYNHVDIAYEWKVGENLCPLCEALGELQEAEERMKLEERRADDAEAKLSELEYKQS